MAVTSAALSGLAQQTARADYTIDIAAYELDVAPRRTIKTLAYNRQVPGPLLRLQESRRVTYRC
jgi:FtsP/CotA-like multicopper oxidase with cupredoxin domain